MDTRLVIATGAGSIFYGPMTMVFFDIEESVAAERFERRYGSPPSEVVSREIHRHDALQVSNDHVVVIPFGVKG